MRTLVGALLAISLLVAGCGDDDGDADLAHDVTFTDDGTRFEVAGGEEFVVVLESNATTGFAWVPEVELDPGVVELVDDTYVAPDSDLVGAPGRQELTFRAVGEGSTFISLWYVRPFDDPPEPAGRAQYEVIVASGVPPDADEPSDGDGP